MKRADKIRERRAESLGQGGVPLAEIAVELGVTPQMVQKIERSALKKLHRALRIAGFRFVHLAPDDRREALP